jgi:hypothetical protein
VGWGGVGWGGGQCQAGEGSTTVTLLHIVACPGYITCAGVISQKRKNEQRKRLDFFMQPTTAMRGTTQGVAWAQYVRCLSLPTGEIRRHRRYGSDQAASQ